MILGEIVNNKIFTVHENMNMPLKQVYRKTNEMVVYEVLNNIQDFSNKPKK